MTTGRFEEAKVEMGEAINKLFQKNKLSIENSSIFLRAFKKEMELELWAKAKSENLFIKLKSYPFCKLSGELGPKRKEGDLQVPEGLYFINRFNEQSKFHLSLGINYPNKSDKILGDRLSPGSDIFIHGKCETVGCIPITDFWIKELFVIAKNATNFGQKRIPVHIFPFRMEQTKFEEMLKLYPSNQNFWKNLFPIFNAFERSKTLESFSVDDFGNYHLGIQNLP